eukprot:14072929-Heterocapsa_arctica.AAC.1
MWMNCPASRCSSIFALRAPTPAMMSMTSVLPMSKLMTRPRRDTATKMYAAAVWTSRMMSGAFVAVSWMANAA